MKKLFFATLLLAFVSLGTSLKAQVYEQGQNIIQGGIGFGSAYIGSGLNGGLPPIHASFEHGLKEKIGVGALIGYSTAKSNTIPFFGGEYKYSYLVVGARGAYHFYNEDKIDAYGGLMLGYNIASVKYTGSANGLTAGNAGGGFAFGAFVGGRYALTDQLHAFGEVGYSIAWLSVGIGYKL